MERSTQVAPVEKPVPLNMKCHETIEITGRGLEVKWQGHFA